jgi:DNA polymerase V
LEYSAKVIETYLQFVSEDDLYIYSIDEAFLDVTEYLAYYQKDEKELAKMILEAIYNQTKLFATCGIGPNMLMAKLALDIESKKNADFIATWRYEDISTKLWPVTPLSKMWGIGNNMERRLNQLGLFSIGDIAKFDRSKLKKTFGILGEELYYHTHGIDMSLIQEKYKLKPASKSYGIGQTLFHDYYVPDIFQIIREMVDDVCSRMRIGRKKAKTISLGIGYSKEVMGGFYRQITLEQPTASPTTVYQTCMHLFEMFYDDEPIRRVNISVSNFADSSSYQFSLFEDIEQIEKEQELFMAVDQIKERFGKNSINRASSETKASTIKERNKMIGGHHA